MAKYTIQTNSGNIYDIEAPDNATEQQLFAFAKDYEQSRGDDIQAKIDDAIREQPESVPERTIKGTAGDIAVTAGKGLLGLAETGVGLADIATEGAAGKYLDEHGYGLKAEQVKLDSYYSDAQKAANEKVESADGFVDTASAMLENPSTIVKAAGESLPSMFVGGALGKGLAATSKVAPYIAGALGEGAVTAGQQAEGIRQQTKDGYLTPEQSALAIASGIGTGVIGAAAGRVAEKFGLTDIDTLFAGGDIASSNTNVLKRVLGGAISEGVLEEMPQSSQEKMLENIALDKDPFEGVGSAAAAGTLTGGLMGGAGGLLHKGRANNSDTQPASPLDDTTPQESTTPLGETIKADEATADNAPLNDNLGNLNSIIQNNIGALEHQKDVVKAIEEETGVFDDNVGVDDSIKTLETVTDLTLKNHALMNAGDAVTEHQQTQADIRTQQAKQALADEQAKLDELNVTQSEVDKQAQDDATHIDETNKLDEWINAGAVLNGNVLEVEGNKRPVGKSQLPYVKDKIKARDNTETELQDKNETKPDAQAIVDSNTIPAQDLQSVIDAQTQSKGGYNPLAGAWETPSFEDTPENETVLPPQSETNTNQNAPQTPDAVPVSETAKQSTSNQTPFASYENIEGATEPMSHKTANAKLKTGKFDSNDYVAVPINDKQSVIAPIESLSFDQYAGLKENANQSRDSIVSAWEGITGKIAPTETPQKENAPEISTEWKFTPTHENILGDKLQQVTNSDGEIEYVDADGFTVDDNGDIAPIEGVKTEGEPSQSLQKVDTVQNYPVHADEKAKGFLDKGKFTEVEVKNGEKIKLVNMQDNESGGSIHAFDANGNQIGSLGYFTNKDYPTNPAVNVDKEHRRKGVATAMYDLAEKTGGVIPSTNDNGQVRTKDGQAFRFGRDSKAVTQGDVSNTPAPLPIEKVKQIISSNSTKSIHEFDLEQELKDLTNESRTNFMFLIDQYDVRNKNASDAKIAQRIAETHDLSNPQTMISYSVLSHSGVDESDKLSRNFIANSATQRTKGRAPKNTTSVSQEQKLDTKQNVPLDSTQAPILKKDGTPFQTKAAANLTINRKSRTDLSNDTHDVVELPTGGFGIVAKGNQIQPAAQTSSESEVVSRGTVDDTQEAKAFGNQKTFKGQGGVKEQKKYDDDVKARNDFADKYKGTPFAYSVTHNDFEKAVLDLNKGYVSIDDAQSILNDAVENNLIEKSAAKTIQEVIDDLKPVENKQVDDNVSKNDTGIDTLDKDIISKGYTHRSHSVGDRVKMEQEWFDNSVKSLRETLESLATNDNQKAEIENLVDNFKEEYKNRRYQVMKAGESVTSSFIAGRNNFNSKQANTRGSTLDQAESNFSKWLKSAQLEAERKIADLRTQEQKDADISSANNERVKKLIKPIISDLATIGQIDNGSARGYDRSSFVNSAVRKIENLYKNNEVEALKDIFEQIANYDAKNKKPLFAKNNKVWQFKPSESAEVDTSNEKFNDALNAYKNAEKKPAATQPQSEPATPEKKSRYARSGEAKAFDEQFEKEKKEKLAVIGELLAEANVFAPKAVKREALNPAKLSNAIADLMQLYIQKGIVEFKELSREIMSDIYERFGDAGADAITIRHLKGAYVSFEPVEGSTSDADVMAFASIDELYQDDESASDNKSENDKNLPSNDLNKWSALTDSLNTEIMPNSLLLSKSNGITTYIDKDNDVSTDDVMPKVHAVKDGKVIGRAFFVRHPETGLLEGHPEVHPDYRRQGVASRIFDDFENYAGEKTHPAYDGQSDDANAFWKNRGKSSTIGNTVELSTPKEDMRVNARYEVVNDGTVITSHDTNLRVNPRFPQELQPRNRAAKSYEIDLQNKVANFNPERVGASATTDSGAPIVDKNGNVISGNGRAIALKKLSDKSYSEYKQWLMDNADEFGLDADVIAKMPRPVLVRRLTDTNVNLGELARKSNDSTIKEMSVVEQAFSDADSIDEETFTLYDGGSLTTNRSFVTAFIQATGADNIYDAQGMLSQKGITRIESAIMAKAYGDDTIVADLYENADTEVKSLLNALLKSSANWLKLRAAFSETNIKDLTQHLTDAVMLVKKARMSGGQTVKSLVSQRDLMSGDSVHPITEKFVKLFFYDDNLSKYISGDKVAEILNAVSSNMAKSLVNADVFGEALTPNQILDKVYEQYIKAKQESKPAPRGYLGDLFNPVTTRGDKRRKAESGKTESGQGTDSTSVTDEGRETLDVVGLNNAPQSKFVSYDDRVEKAVNGVLLRMDKQKFTKEKAISFTKNNYPTDGEEFWNDVSKIVSERIEGNKNVPSTNTDLERDSTVTNSANSRNETPVFDGSTGDADLLGQSSEPVKSTENVANSDSGDSISIALTGGEQGDNQLLDGNETDVIASSDARDSDSGRSGQDSINGMDVKRDGSNPIKELPAKSVKGLKAKQVKHQAADLENVKEAMPFLNEGQADDVVFAEKRFEEHNGVMFTNGTGTGKTFTGLGIVSRFASQGKNNILIVAPSQNILDSWVKTAKNFFDLNVNILKNTKDMGVGITATTYDNFSDNITLVNRDWDLIVTDEAHYLMANAAGTDTAALDRLRGLTGHEDGFYHWFNAKHSELVAEHKKVNDKNYFSAISDNVYYQERGEKEEHQSKINNQYNETLEAAREEWKTKESKTKVTMLSATPFAYESNIDYANGYLFDYPKADGSAYNSGSGKDQFFMQHLGYRMRYNKLTKPDAKVDRSTMQRQFNEHLKKTGAVSARTLDVSFDYDRQFILTESAIGQEIDRALQWLSDNDARELSEKINESFDHLARRYLLEAIKAKEIIPVIKEHLAAGRKVLVFHDYKKGGATNPFNIKSGDEKTNKQYQEFKRAFPDLTNSNALSDLLSPIERFEQEFGKDALIYNGDVSSKERIARVAQFNDDNSGKNLILLQSASAKEGVSFHDTTGVHQRVLINIGLPTAPTTAIQQEGRIYRVGQQSDAIFRYVNTGTSWERWAFASTIAGRASEAENLALGEGARGLRDAFINAFENSDSYPVGHEGEGKGGKDSDKQAYRQITEMDRAKGFYYATQKKNSRTKSAEGTDYYATPEPVGLVMTRLADAREGEKMLEPSAGHGAIARWFRTDAERTAIEPSSELNSRLALVFQDGDIKRQTFEDLNIVNKFDAIVMNPPFGTGGKTAIEHLEKAFNHLRDGGRVVALIPEGAMADKRLDAWLNSDSNADVKPLAENTPIGAIYEWDTVSYKGWSANGKKLINKKFKVASVIFNDSGFPVEMSDETGDSTVSINKNRLELKPTGERPNTSNKQLVADISLPTVTFERAGTKVKTHIIVIEKTTESINTKNVNYSGIDDINELFDKIDGLTIPDRVKPVEEVAETPAAQAETTSPTGESFTPDEKENFDHYAKISADSLASLRKTDLDRVLEQAQDSERSKFARYIASVRPDLFEEIHDIMKEDYGKENWHIAPATKTIGTLVEGKHTKTGEAIFTVKTPYNKEAYSDWSNAAKRFGGFYSRYTKGFLFKTKDAANQFMDYLSGGDNSEVKYSTNSEAAPAVETHTEKSFMSTAKSALDAKFGKGWFERLWGTGSFEAISNDEALRMVGKDDLKSVGKGGLLAPNGKPSNLNAMQHAQVRTPEFKTWFGDWENDPENASKVVDENGEPLVVYHGSTKSFDSFSKDKLGNTTKAASASKGFFFTPDIDTATSYTFLGDTEIGDENILKLKELSNALDVAKGELSELYKANEKNYNLVFSAKTKVEKAEKKLLDFPMQVEKERRNELRKHLERVNQKEDAAFDKSGIKSYRLWSDTVEGKYYAQLKEDIEEMIGRRGWMADNAVLYPVFLNLKNPIIKDFNNSRYRDESYNALLIKAQQEGNDSAIFKNTRDAADAIIGNYTDILVALDENQIKSATGNTGSFSKDNNDIRYSKDGKIEAFYIPYKEGDPKSDKVYFVPENISKDRDVAQLALHEIGVHMMRLGQNQEEFDAILSDVASKRESNPLVKEAFESAIEAGTKSENLNEEALARLVDKHPELKLSQRFMAWFKQAVRNFAKRIKGSDKLAFIQWANKLNEKDWVYMATSALRSAPSDVVFKEPSGRNAIIKASKEGYKGNSQSEAVEWLRAVEKGLDMSFEARMERAKAMGFDVDQKWYHGTKVSNQLEGFKTDATRLDGSRTSGYGAISFSSDPDFANDYAGAKLSHAAYLSLDESKVGQVIPVFLKTKNAFNYRNNEHINQAKDWIKSNTDYSEGKINRLIKELQADKEGDNDNWDIIESDLVDIRNNDGYNFFDSYGYKGAYAVEFDTLNFIAYHPENIRSIFAAFDPDYADSADLLASKTQSTPDPKGIREKLIADAAPIRHIPATREAWDKDFPDGFADTPIGRVKLGENQFDKLVGNERDLFAGLVKPTLENPTFIVLNDRQAKVFVKTFVKKDGKLRGFASISIKKDGIDIVISSHPKDMSWMIKEVNSGELLYSRYSELDSTKSPERQFTNAGGLDETISNDIKFSKSLTPSNGGNGSNTTTAKTGTVIPSGHFEIPKETATDKVRAAIQNDLLRLKTFVDAIKKQGGIINDNNDFYQATSIAPNIAAASISDFKKRIIDPLFKRMADLGVTQDDVGLLAYAKHAAERNDAIQAINDRFKKNGGGSGMTNEQAQEIIDGFKDEFGNKFIDLENLANDWQKITVATRDILEQSGDISPETAKQWRDTYDYYVPLKGFEEVDEDGNYRAGNGVGKGFSTTSKFSKRALGRESRAGQILENIERDLERAIIRSTNLYVAKTLAQAIDDNPDTDLWEKNVMPIQPVMGKAKPQYHLFFNGSYVATRDTLRDARRFRDSETDRTGQSKKEYTIVKEGGDPKVTSMIKPVDLNDEIVYFENGKQVRIRVYDKSFTEAFNRLADDGLFEAFKLMSAFNRMQRHVLTTLYPAFIIANGFMVDPATAFYANTGRNGFKFATKAFKNSWQAAKALYQCETTGTAKDAYWQDMIEQYRRTGGSTGVAYVASIDRKVDEFNKALARASDNPYDWKNNKLESATNLLYRVVDNKFFNLVETLGTVSEQAQRLSTYAQAREEGLSQQKAAVLSQNVTVNFGKRGQFGREIGATWLFSNAGIQGIDNFVDVVTKGEHKKQAQALLAASVAAGFLIAMLNGDDGDDDLIPETEKQRYIQIPLGNGVRLDFKLPYANSFFFDIGRAVYRTMAGGNKEKIAGKLMSSFFTNFMPLGNPMPNGYLDARDAMVAFSPQMFKLFTMLGTNRNAFGSDLFPENVFNEHQPDSEKAFRVTRGSLADDFAKSINRITGGDEAKEGLVSFSPESVKATISFMGGGFARTIFDTVDALYTGVRNPDELKVNQIPVLKNVVKSESLDDYRRRMYSQIDDIDKLHDEFKSYQTSGNKTAIADLKKESGKLLSLSSSANAIKNQIKDLRDDQDKALKAGNVARVKSLETKERIAIMNFNKKYQQASK